MPPSSNKSVSSASSNPKKHKKKMKKRDKHRDKKEAVTDQHHHKKHREHKEPKEPRRGNSGKSSSSKRHRPFLGPRVYWLVLAVVSVVLSSVGVYNYKTTTRSPMRPTGAPVPGTNAPNTCSEEGQKEQAVLRQRRQKPINLRPLLRSLAHKFQRIFTHVIESPFFPEARATRLRSRALQEMRLNNEPLQDDPPYHPFPGYSPRPRARAVAGKHLQAQREQHRAALRAIRPLILNGQEQDCVSPRCLIDGTFPFFRWLEKQQRRLISPQRLCNFILQWGKGEMELEASKSTGMHEASAREL